METDNQHLVVNLQSALELSMRSRQRGLGYFERDVNWGLSSRFLSRGAQAHLLKAQGSPTTSCLGSGQLKVSGDRIPVQQTLQHSCSVPKVSELRRPRFSPGPVHRHLLTLQWLQPPKSQETPHPDNFSIRPET